MPVFAKTGVLPEGRAELLYRLTDGLGDDESASDVDVNEATEHVVVVHLGLDVGASGLSVEFRDSREIWKTYSAIPAALMRTSSCP